MNHFILSKSNTPVSGKFQLKLTSNYILTIQGDNYHQYNQDGISIIIVGDYIGDSKTLFSTPCQDIPKLRGNFYAIVVDKEEISLFSSFLNVLPIYFTSDYTFISSSIAYIRAQAQQEFLIDKKFILEILLFNYGFFNRTLYQDILLVPCHSFFVLHKDKVEVKKHFETTSLFAQHPTYGSRVADRLSDLFIETSKHYFPDDPFDIAFTSGFDGRTLVSCAAYHNKDFKTFSFGKPGNDDVAIPKANAADLGIPYQYFDLGKDAYTDKAYFDNALEYTKNAPGGNGFIYAHFLYSTKEIANNSSYLISGVVGSELFRALHLTGAVTSQSLVDIFMGVTAEEVRNKIKNAEALNILRKEEFTQELEELTEELIAYKNSLPDELTPNQQFYIFVFEEIFRKFFGQWISMQMQHINVRTPFLDYNFIKELLTTQYAGANNEFLTKNPLKRMKGQYIYTDIIKKTNTVIYHQKTGKGYRPKDLRESIFLYKIIIPFILKRFKRKVGTPNLDNLGIISGIITHKEHIKTLLNETIYFDVSKLNKILDDLSPYTPEKERDTLLMGLSIALVLQNNAQSNTQNLIYHE